MFGTAYKIVRKIELFAEFGVMVVNASFAHIHSPSVLYHYCMCSAQFYSPVQAFEEEFILRISSKIKRAARRSRRMFAFGFRFYPAAVSARFMFFHRLIARTVNPF